ncbi:MAG: CehA/McbA family metallohydrolase, partial [Eubacteriales bacterium]|nr:CehA/McbA family metallohydrolase [Eubacteriales bacterium]
MTLRMKTAGSRVLSLLMVLAMLLAMLPGWALAAGERVTYTRVTELDELVDGQYAMVARHGYAMTALDGTWVQTAAVTADDLSAAGVWTLSKDVDAVTRATTATLTDANGVTIAPKGGNNNGIKGDAYSWGVTCTDGWFTFTGRGEDTVTLASNVTSGNKFRAYKNATIEKRPDSYPSAFALYRIEQTDGETIAPTITVAAPQATPQGGTVASGTAIALHSTTADAAVYYTLDGTTPTTDSPRYDAAQPPVITGEAGDTVVLTAVAMCDGTQSAVQRITYTVQAEQAAPAPVALPFAAGDQVVIYAPAYGKALSSTMAGYYQAGVDVTASADSQLTGYGATELWTVAVNEDGSVSFAQDGQKLGMEDSYSSMPLGSAHDRWELTALENGLYLVRNTVRGNYIEWYAGKGNWSSYNDENAANDDQYQLAFHVHTGTLDGGETIAPDPVDTLPVKDGDEVALYSAKNKMAVDTTLSGAVAEIEDGQLLSKGDVTFVVEQQAGAVRFRTKSGGLYLTSAATGNKVTLETTPSEYSLWVLEAADGGWNIKNANAQYNDNAQYLEYYNGFKTFSYKDSYAQDYVFRFCPVGEMPVDVSDLVVAAAPAAGASVMPGDQIALSTIEGASIYYTTDGTAPTVENGTRYTAPIEVTDVPFTVKALAYLPADDAAGTPAKTGNVVTFSYQAGMTVDGLRPYFGQLHAHTNISDGAGSITDAFRHAAAVEGLDFLAVTDHSNSFDNDTASSIGLDKDCTASSEWVMAHQAADAATTDDFVGIYGFEMTWSDGFGHMNTFNTPGFESRSNAAFGNRSGKTDGYELYYDKLVSVPDSLSQFNHPGTTFGDFQDFDFYTPARDQRITLIEVGNGEGAIGSSGYFPSYEYYTRALDKGWHVAPTNNQDNHKGNWGDSNTARSVVLADSLSREAIYDAIANYRVYATEDNDLSIVYSLNDHVMGSILGEQPAVSIRATIADPTDKADAKVEVIVDGGKVAASQTLDGCNGTVAFDFDSNDYAYYYLRITQADQHIAVTAPVWTGESVSAGIAGVRVDSDLVVKDEPVTVTASVYNNTTATMQVTGLTFTEGDTVCKTLTADELAEAGLAAMASGASVAYALPFTPAKAGNTSIKAELTATIGGTDYTFTETLALTVTDPSLVTRILVDGTHYNDYVTGYYANNMGNFSALAATKNAQVTIKQPGETIAPADLEGVSLLVVSAPLKKTQNGVSPTADNATFSADFIQMVADYAQNGGTVILCGIADYQDAADGAPFASTEQINPILEAMGATLRLLDDEVLEDDTNYNGGATQTYRVYTDFFNTDDPTVAGLFAGMGDKRYSAFSGASVDLGENGTWLVKGSPNCYSINSRDRKDKGRWSSEQPIGVPTSGSYVEADAVVKKGDVVLLATEAVGAGRVFVGGTVFLSNFEISSDGTSNDYGDASYANKVIVANLLDSLVAEPTVSDIATVRAAYQSEADKGKVFTVEGKVTATNIAPNAFYDTLYIQDATGGLDIYPVATVTDAADANAYPLGQTVRVTGALDDYQGDIELRAIKIERIDASTADKVAPTKLTLTEAADYAKNGGLLASVTGKVKAYTLTSGQLDTVTLTDGAGNDYRLLFNNYIGYSDASSAKLEGLVKQGATLTAVGVVYTDPDGACLR